MKDDACNCVMLTQPLNISESYTFGDVTKTVVSSIKSNQLDAVKSTQQPLLIGAKSVDDKVIEQSVSEALEKWDDALMKKEEMKDRKAKVEQYVELIEKGE